MNILDDNSENVLLQKNPIWETLGIGIGIPVFITFLFFVYLFGNQLTYTQLDLTFFEHKILISKISLLVLFLFFLIFFLFPVGWVKNFSPSKSSINLLQILILPLIIISIFLSMWGIVAEVPLGGWEAYPPLAINNYESFLKKLSGFDNVMFIVSIIGLLSFKYLKDKANEHPR